MKILITSDVFVKIDGVSTSVKNLYDSLVQMGHDVRVLTLSSDYKNRKTDNIYFVKSASLSIVYKGIRMPLSFNYSFYKELVDWKPDVIHSQCEVFSYEYALKVSKKTGAPIIHTYHTMYDEYVGYITPFKRLGRWVIRKLTKTRLKKVEVIVAPTKKVAKAIHNYGLKNAVEIVPTGISLEQHKIKISPTKRNQLRKSLGVNDSDILLINLGRVASEKNIQELLKYFKNVSETNSRLKFMIVGDGPYRKNLEKLTVLLGIENKVVFVGMVKPSEVHIYYQLGDIFVSASTSETQGLTYVEALANGLPLVCKRDDCLEGVLIEGQTGYTFNSGFEFNLSVKKLLNKVDRDIISKNCLKRSCAFDKKQFGSNIVKIYDKALNKKAN